MPTPHRITYRLSLLVVVLTALSLGAGLFFHDLYRDNALVAWSWYGNDLVTLLVATPLLVVALLGAWGGSRRAYLVWMGLLAYSLYNSAFYLFGAAFNSLYLVYAALFALSGFATGVRPRVPRRACLAQTRAVRPSGPVDQRLPDGGGRRTGRLLRRPLGPVPRDRTAPPP